MSIKTKLLGFFSRKEKVVVMEEVTVMRGVPDESMFTHRLIEDYGPTIHINQKYPAGTKLVLVDPDHDISTMDIYLFPDGRRGWLDRSVVEELSSVTSPSSPSSPSTPNMTHIVTCPIGIELSLDPATQAEVDTGQVDISKMYPATMPVPIQPVHDQPAQEALEWIAAGENVDAETARLLAEKQSLSPSSHEKMSDIQLIAYVDDIFDNDRTAVFKATRDEKVIIDPINPNVTEKFTKHQIVSSDRYSRWTWKHIIRNYPGFLELFYYQKNK